MGKTKLYNGFGRRRNPGLVGLEITDGGIAFAWVKFDGAAVAGSGQPDSARLQCCEFLHGDAAATNPAQSLRESIQARQLMGMPCNIALPSGSYQLLLMEAPKVPAEELRDAMRWRVKELIHYPLDEVVIDVFPLPRDSRRAGTAMVYVVAARRNQIVQALDLAAEAGLKVESIDITELALRNLAEHCAEDERGLALVKLRQGAGSLALIRQGNLYLSRQFELAYNAGLFDELPHDALVLELQRSLDYYERQMGQAPPGRIYLCGENVCADKITDAMRTNLSAALEVLDPGQHLACSAEMDECLWQQCAVAVGAALRKKDARERAT